MDIKMKLVDVLSLNQTLKAIIDTENSKIDSLFKFKLLGIMKSIDQHVLNFEVIRNEKIMEYGKKNEDGSIEIKNDDEETVKKFNESLQPVLNNEVTINIDKLKVEDVFNKGVNAEYLIGLYQIIEGWRKEILCLVKSENI